MAGSDLEWVLMGTQPPPSGSRWLLSGQSPREIKGQLRRALFEEILNALLNVHKGIIAPEMCLPL